MAPFATPACYYNQCSSAVVSIRVFVCEWLMCGDDLDLEALVPIGATHITRRYKTDT